MVKKLPYEEFKKIYSKVPRLCVDLVIKNSQGVLLTKRDIFPDKGWWHTPGGTVLLGETLEDTVNRVSEEELSTKVEIQKLLGVLEYTEGSGFGYPISVVFKVKPKGVIVGGEQAKTIGFFKKLPQKTLPELRKFLKREFNLN